MINLKNYFTRIGYTGSADVSAQTLINIHRAQAFSIPFENLDIHDLSNTTEHLIKLDEQSLENKMVNNNRGGYCHETNELLALVLLQLGFKVDRLAARVLVEDNIPIGHKLLLVTIGKEKYIADVGFGGNGLIEPIPLTIDTEFKQFSETFKLSKRNKSYILWFKVRDTWNKLYSFTLNPYLAVDYEAFNYYVSHEASSIFVTNRICTLPTKTGRIILNNMTLKIRAKGKNESLNLKPNEYLKTLNKYFGIKLLQTTKFKPVA